MLKAASVVLGVLWLQHMAQLPSVWQWLAMLGFIAIVLACRARLESLFSCCNLFFLLALLFAGVLWASAMAHLRLSDELPFSWQQKEIEVMGVIASLPEVTPSRTRFRFKVEKVLTPGATVPAHINLNLYPLDWGGISQTPAIKLHAGERWQWTVKLKRPHSSLNPHGFDFAGWALARNIRALGYVRTKQPMKRLQPFVWGVPYVIDHLRGSVQAHIQSVLPRSPLSGVVTALVIGEDAGIQPDTWTLMLRTGITHLMSIYYVLKHNFYFSMI